MFEVGTGSLLSSNELVIGNVPRISAKSDANGITGYFDSVNLANARHCENFISVNFFGSDGGIFYHPYLASVEMKVHTLKIPNVCLNSQTGVFIASTLKTVLNDFGYGSQLSSSKLKNENYYIQLPTKNGEIDFNFMEEFVRELEEERVRELEEERVRELAAYLKVSGLEDYVLTEEEEKAIANFDRIEWDDFKYKDIFNHIKQGRRLKKDDQQSGDIPFVMAGVTNTGVVNYISNPVAYFPENSITIDIFGNTFYRNYSYGAGDDTGVYWSDKKRYNEATMLFFATAMEKSLINKFSYGKKLRSSQSFNFKMKLPEKNNALDYASMETLIKAIQKLVIKDVVLFKDSIIDNTKTVISK